MSGHGRMVWCGVKTIPGLETSTFPLQLSRGTHAEVARLKLQAPVHSSFHTDSCVRNRLLWYLQYSSSTSNSFLKSFRRKCRQLVIDVRNFSFDQKLVFF